MKAFLWILLGVSTILTGCQFTESMVLNEDGSGRMELSVDLSEIMAMSDEFAKDSSMVKQDTIIAFRDILREKKDSIAKLPKKEQKRLQRMENYKIHMMSDPETKKFVVDIFTDFTKVDEANELMKGFDLSSDYMPGGSSGSKNDDSDTNEEEVIGVAYSYAKGVFKRDAFIKDPKMHQQQLDSMQQTASFLSGITYKINYTFPRKVKSASVQDATLSLDGKTLQFERNFLEYFKNPDVMDLEVELEK